MRKGVPKRLRLPTMDSDLSAYEMHLTPNELADRWRIHAGTLRNWRHQQRGPSYISILGRALYPISAVLAFERESMVMVNKQLRPLAGWKEEQKPSS